MRRFFLRLVVAIVVMIGLNAAVPAKAQLPIFGNAFFSFRPWDSSRQTARADLQGDAEFSLRGSREDDRIRIDEIWSEASHTEPYWPNVRDAELRLYMVAKTLNAEQVRTGYITAYQNRKRECRRVPMTYYPAKGWGFPLVIGRTYTEPPCGKKGHDCGSGSWTIQAPGRYTLWSNLEVNDAVRVTELGGLNRRRASDHPEGLFKFSLYRAPRGRLSREDLREMNRAMQSGSVNVGRLPTAEVPVGPGIGFMPPPDQTPEPAERRRDRRDDRREQPDDQPRGEPASDEETCDVEIRLSGELANGEPFTQCWLLITGDRFRAVTLVENGAGLVPVPKRLGEICISMMRSERDDRPIEHPHNPFKLDGRPIELIARRR